MLRWLNGDQEVAQVEGDFIDPCSIPFDELKAHPYVEFKSPCECRVTAIAGNGWRRELSMPFDFKKGDSVSFLLPRVI